MSEFPSFLRLNNIPLYGYVTFCLSIHPSVDTWVASTFWLLWIMLLWTWLYKYLLKNLLSLPWGILPEVEFLGQMVILHLIFWGTSILFSIMVEPIYNPINSAQGFCFLHILTNTHFFVLLITAILTVWGTISLWFWSAFPWWLVMLNIFSCAYCLSVYLLWRNI